MDNSNADHSKSGHLKSIIESLLFVSDGPLTVDRIHNLLEQGERKTIREAIAKLSQEYDEQERAFYLSEVAGGYQLRTRPQYAEWARKLKQSKPQRLSRAAMEILAIIAYKQPVLRTDIEHLRGVDCGGVVRMLLERGVIRVLGRKDLPGRPMVYGTSKRFLEMFDLKDLRNLPTLKDMQELGEISPSDSDTLIEETLEDHPASFDKSIEEIGETRSSDFDESIQEIDETEPNSPNTNHQELDEVWPNDSN